MDSGLITLNAFSAELLHDLELLANLDLLLRFLNPALFIVLLNNDDNINLTEAMNGPNSSGFMTTKEKKIEALVETKAFLVVDKEP